MKDFAVIFDMDGVVVESNPYHRKAWKGFFKNHGFQITEKDFKLHINGRTNSDILTHYFGRLSKEQIKRYIEEKEIFYRRFIEHSMKSPKGLYDFLAMLESKDIPLAIATSAPPENVKFILTKLKIKRYFDAIVDDTMVSAGKPDPEIYLKTAKMLNFPPKRCIVIEDSLSGIKSGLNAGMKVIGITTTHTKKELSIADMVIDDFSELTLKKLERVGGR